MELAWDASPGLTQDIRWIAPAHQLKLMDKVIASLYVIVTRGFNIHTNDHSTNNNIKPYVDAIECQRVIKQTYIRGKVANSSLRKKKTLYYTIQV